MYPVASLLAALLMEEMLLPMEQNWMALLLVPMLVTSQE